MTLPRTRNGRVLGRLPAKIPPALRTFKDYATSPLPTPPVTFPAPAGAWNMDGNDEWGDCVCAAAGNSIAAADVEVAEADQVPTAAQAVAEYQKLTGAQTPGDANDTGLVISDVLKLWATAPGLFGDNVIAGYAPVAISGLDEIKQGIAAYGAVNAGVNLPQSAEDQFNAGQPWTYVGDEPIGGHDIVFVGYDTSNLTAVTWGATVQVTPEWVAHYLEEAWVTIPQAFVHAGKGPEVNLAELQADIGSLDGPPPPPPPPPVPPTPVPPTPKPPTPKPPHKKRRPPWWQRWFNLIWNGHTS